MPITNSSNVTKPTVEMDSRVEFNVNKNLSERQRAGGVLAKVQIRHPAFTATATVWNTKRVTFPQQEQERGDKKTYFTLIQLNKEVRDYILWLVENDGADEDLGNDEPWYMKDLGAKTITLSAEDTCPDLGIESIIADANMSAKQLSAGMMYKVNLVTTIGTLYGYTVSKSRFGAKALHGIPPTDGNSIGEDGQRGVPAYRLSPDATQVVLAYLHANTEDPTWARVEGAVAASPRNNAPTGGSAPVGNFAPITDDTVFNSEE